MLLVINIVNQLCHLAMVKAEKTGREFYLYQADEASSYLQPEKDVFSREILEMGGCWSILDYRQIQLARACSREKA